MLGVKNASRMERYSSKMDKK